MESGGNAHKSELNMLSGSKTGGVSENELC